jgi:hypothetical protein
MLNHDFVCGLLKNEGKGSYWIVADVAAFGDKSFMTMSMAEGRGWKKSTRTSHGILGF